MIVGQIVNFFKELVLPFMLRLLRSFGIITFFATLKAFFFKTKRLKLNMRHDNMTKAGPPPSGASPVPSSLNASASDPFSALPELIGSRRLSTTSAASSGSSSPEDDTKHPDFVYGAIPAVSEDITSEEEETFVAAAVAEGELEPYDVHEGEVVFFFLGVGSFFRVF
jgi:hypothetical protein